KVAPGRFTRPAIGIENRVLAPRTARCRENSVQRTLTPVRHGNACKLGRWSSLPHPFRNGFCHMRCRQTFLEGIGRHHHAPLPYFLRHQFFPFVLEPSCAPTSTLRGSPFTKASM